MLCFKLNLLFNDMHSRYSASLKAVQSSYISIYISVRCIYFGRFASLITYSLITPKYALRCVFLYLSTVIFNSIIFHIYVSLLYMYTERFVLTIIYLFFIIPSLCFQQYKYSNFNTILFHIYMYPYYIYICMRNASRGHQYLLILLYFLYTFIYKYSDTLI